MSKQTVNEDFILMVPDSFQPMSREDLSHYFPDGDPNRWGVQDKENHVIITALWKQYPALLAKLASLNTMVKRNQQLVCEGYEGHSYRLSEYLSMQAGEAQAEGYRFTFRLGDILQAADTYLIKHGRVVYSLSCIGREENKMTDQALFRTMLESLRFL